VGAWSGPSRLDYSFITGCLSAGNDVVSTRWRVNIRTVRGVKWCNGPLCRGQIWHLWQPIICKLKQD
jgi:hypothetical protein